MKKLKLLIFCFIGLSFSFCGNDDDGVITYESQGTILGLDVAQCGCCGNWLLTIGDDLRIRQFQTFPENSDIDLSTVEFPLAVRFNWSETNIDCVDHIIIDAIDVLTD